jgi:uncharacterized protein
VVRFQSPHEVGSVSSLLSYLFAILRDGTVGSISTSFACYKALEDRRAKLDDEESEGRSPIYHEHRPHPRRRAGGFRKILKNAVERSLVPRERRFYELFKQQAATLVRAAGLLERALADSTNLSMLQREIKDLENQGDELTHEIVSTLQRTFVTPFDHEDIYALAAGLDDILDYIEEVADTANLYGIITIPEPARELAGLLVQAVAQLEQAIDKLESGRGSEDYGAEIHRLEDVGDSTARHAIAELFGGQLPPLEIIKLKDLYVLLEDALDRCEQVANVLEGIIVKNA